MTPGELKARATVATCAGAVVMAVPFAWLAGAAAGLGILAGGALAVVNFRWLAARAEVAAAAPGLTGALWHVGAVLRFGLVAAVAGVLFVSGWAHPVALLAGFTVLPCAIVALGLHAARQEA
ncbi:MAG TPA: ATP synthase subunit I [Candidatus Limnocylindria bacterium]|nr:ATP synthase subunit I [Candidatus Limnocylindria bacterium]